MKILYSNFFIRQQMFYLYFHDKFRLARTRQVHPYRFKLRIDLILQ